MAEVKLVVMYPVPKDIEAFEKVYQNEHVPMGVEKLAGKTKIVATKVLTSPHGKSAFYRIAEVYFPSMRALDSAPHPIEARKLSPTPYRSRPGEPQFS